MNSSPRENKKVKKLESKFQGFANAVDKVVGSPFWFSLSVFIVVVWALSGFFIGFGHTWQLIINTFTTVMTFLMISLLHSSQQKWEEKIERMQDSEATNILEIKEDTERMSSKEMASPEEGAPQDQG